MLISPEYQAQQQQMHENPKIVYGSAAAKIGPEVAEMVDMMEIDHLLDYGCGSRRSLMETFAPQRAVKVQCYDPGVPEYSGMPEPAEMVLCCDVLEHIEPDLIDNVLDHLESLTQRFLFATVATTPAGKKLPDGRNAHLIIKPYSWWLPKFMERFDVHGFRQGAHGFQISCFANDYDSGKRTKQ